VQTLPQLLPSAEIGTAQQENPVEPALAYTLEVLISLREAAIEVSCKRHVSHEKCLAEIIDNFIKENDLNGEITHKVYDSLFQLS
jgi:hypothetical protein